MANKNVFAPSAGCPACGFDKGSDKIVPQGYGASNPMADVYGTQYVNPGNVYADRVAFHGIQAESKIYRTISRDGRVAVGSAVADVSVGEWADADTYIMNYPNGANQMFLVINSQGLALIVRADRGTRQLPAAIMSLALAEYFFGVSVYARNDLQNDPDVDRALASQPISSLTGQRMAATAKPLSIHIKPQAPGPSPIPPASKKLY